MASDRKRDAQQLIDEAAVCHAAGEFDRTIELYRAAERLDPDISGVDLELFLGSVAVSADRDDDAVISFRAVIAADSHHGEAWQWLGEALHRLGRSGEGDLALAEAEQCGEPDRSRADATFAEFETTTELERRARLVLKLVEVGDHRLHEVFRSFLATARAGDIDTCSHHACSAIIDALVGLGVQDDPGIFSDGNAPDRPFIQENIERYFRRPVPPPKSAPRRRGFLGRLFR